MTKKTHIAVGVALTLPLLSLYPKYAFIGIIGSVMPDFDIHTLGLIKHRTITHSLLTLILSAAVVMYFNFSIGLILGYNYAIHLFLDSFTKMGIPIFYPFNKKYYGMKLIKTGGAEDLFVGLLGIGFLVQFILL